MRLEEQIARRIASCRQLWTHHEVHARRRTALAVGALMNSRGLMELIIINIGLQKGIIQPALFSVLVLMAIVTTLMASPIFELVYGRHARAKGELGGIAKGE